MTSTQEGGTLSESDGELIAAARADPHAFTAIFDRHYDAIAGWLRRRVERALAAETFLQAFGARERCDQTRQPAGARTRTTRMESAIVGSIRARP